ncbi:hypothetical protein VIGAN_04194000 [Vigna angularis var. angularis]|uniref:FAS1 domain-containing protein n=1 Tax=Vigna angularis var. angularis TaxID=157739 RepID=A0A0S3RV95_PHAAN|nr:hypothetical protein VIGAN_04194000 [Vigna angularis var. angularis]
MRDPQSGLVSIRSPLTSSQTSSFCPSSKPYPILCHHLRHQFPSHPYDLDLMTSEICLNIVLNITKAVIDGHNFNVIASMLAASGVVQAVLEFEADEGDAGITFFVPVDDAFADLPPYVALQSLHVDKKGVVLKFHVLHSYYPLGSLESVVNPFQPTLATEAMGAGSFTLNISRLNGSISINTDIVQTSVTQTVFDQNLLSFLGFPRDEQTVVTSLTSPPISDKDQSAFIPQTDFEKYVVEQFGKTYERILRVEKSLCRLEKKVVVLNKKSINNDSTTEDSDDEDESTEEDSMDTSQSE